MSPQIDNSHESVLKDRWNKHLIMGYLFLAIVFVCAIASVYYWEDKARARNSYGPVGPRYTTSGEQVELTEQK